MEALFLFKEEDLTRYGVSAVDQQQLFEHIGIFQKKFNFEQKKKDNDAKKHHVTYIFQLQHTVNANIPGESFCINQLTLVIKKDNRKKHNSHQWFFSEQ